MIEISLWLFIVFLLLTGVGITIIGIVIYGSILGRWNYQKAKRKAEEQEERVKEHLFDIRMN